eukprot:6225991-Alexandrium_andersonii.AAC.1
MGALPYKPRDLGNYVMVHPDAGQPMMKMKKQEVPEISNRLLRLIRIWEVALANQGQGACEPRSLPAFSVCRICNNSSLLGVDGRAAPLVQCSLCLMYCHQPCVDQLAQATRDLHIEKASRGCGIHDAVSDLDTLLSGMPDVFAPLDAEEPG